jgi:hypothetical protein
VYEFRTLIVNLHLSAGRNMWQWTLFVVLKSPDRTPAQLEVSGLATSMEAAHAELLWAERLTELKLRFAGYLPRPEL